MEAACETLALTLETNMASLKINEKKRRNTSTPLTHELVQQVSPSTSDPNPETEAMSLRKRIRTTYTETNKRRVKTKPQRIDQDATLKEIENYYLDRRVKALTPTLETIYEEPRHQEVMSKRRFQRLINFDASRQVKKTKKRKSKAKTLAGKRLARKKLTMDLLMTKLSAMQD